MTYTLKTAPASEPVTLAEVRQHCRVSINDDDLYLDNLIVAARRWVENYIKRQLITATWELRATCFPPGGFVLLNPPVTAVSSVKYYNSGNTLTTLAVTQYDVDTYSAPGRIYPAYGKTWPEVYSKANAVVVEYVAGYGLTGASVPADIRHAMMMLISHLYETREPIITGTIVAKVPYACETLLWPYRVLWFE